MLRKALVLVLTGPVWWTAVLAFFVGCTHWALVTPWFEFYLPYNVMHEPLALVMLEGCLWLGVALTLGLFVSAVVNLGSRPMRAPS